MALYFDGPHRAGSVRRSVCPGPLRYPDGAELRLSTHHGGTQDTPGGDDYAGCSNGTVRKRRAGGCGRENRHLPDARLPPFDDSGHRALHTFRWEDRRVKGSLHGDARRRKRCASVRSSSFSPVHPSPCADHKQASSHLELEPVNREVRPFDCFLKVKRLLDRLQVQRDLLLPERPIERCSESPLKFPREAPAIEEAGA